MFAQNPLRSDLHEMGRDVLTPPRERLPVPEEQSARMVEALKAAGGNVNYTVLPEGGHVDAWVHAYGDAGLFDWFLAQRKA